MCLCLQLTLGSALSCHRNSPNVPPWWGPPTGWPQRSSQGQSPSSVLGSLFVSRYGYFGEQKIQAATAKSTWVWCELVPLHALHLQVVSLLDDALADVGSPRPPQLNAAWFKMIVTFDSNVYHILPPNWRTDRKGQKPSMERTCFVSLEFFIHNFVYGFKMTL